MNLFLAAVVVLGARTESTGAGFWDLYEDASGWRVLIGTLSSLDETKLYIERQTGPYEELQEAEDSKKALASDVRESIADVVKAVRKTVDSFVLSPAEVEEKRGETMKTRIEDALGAGDWETENIKKVFQPKTLKEAVVVRLNDMVLLAQTGEGFSAAKDKLKKAVDLMEKLATENIGKQTRSIPRNKNAEEIRKMVVNKLDSVRLLPETYKAVIEDKIKSVQSLVSDKAV
ncbi:MAG: uncharacterized protein A8A55_1934 [Amphiamblys sp. WSBS2006]|nr:MAG: uncharacterized protein A8A55_1934 [Amphiamblys sp. WSBS2006]